MGIDSNTRLASNRPGIHKAKLSGNKMAMARSPNERNPKSLIKLPLNISVAKKRLNNFKQNLKQVAERGENALDNERARLFRQYEAMKQEIQTYENNLGFLSVSSKKGNSLIDEMNRKVQKLKDDMNLVREKIKAIDAENREKES